MAAKIDEEVYWIGGHGHEIINHRWKVPEGCTIIVNSKSAQLKEKEKYIEMYDMLYTIPLEHLQDPSNHYSDIIDIIGLDNAFTIYKENEMCPTFIYTLYDIQKHAGSPYKMTIPSGVINIKQIKEVHADNAMHKNVSYDLEFDLDNDKSDTLLNKISDSYKYSSYPTKEDIQMYLSKQWKEKKIVMKNYHLNYLIYILQEHYLIYLQNMINSE